MEVITFPLGNHYLVESIFFFVNMHLLNKCLCKIRVGKALIPVLEWMLLLPFYR